MIGRQPASVLNLNPLFPDQRPVRQNCQLRTQYHTILLVLKLYLIPKLFPFFLPVHRDCKPRRVTGIISGLRLHLIEADKRHKGSCNHPCSWIPSHFSKDTDLLCTDVPNIRFLKKLPFSGYFQIFF